MIYSADTTQTASNPAETRLCSLTQKQKAGQYAAKLDIGIPSYLPSWLGNTTLEQVQWFRTAQAGRVGIAIWDAQFPDVSWKSAPVWSQLRYIRQH